MVQCLDLSLNFLHHQKMSVIIQAIPPQIKELNLSHNYCEDYGIVHLAERLKTNFSLSSLNLQENKIRDIKLLADSLSLSGHTGSLRYLNLTNNNFDFSHEADIEAFSTFLKGCTNLQVLRLHKMTKQESKVAQDEESTNLSEAIVSALVQSESRRTLRAIEMDLPTEMTWKASERFDACMPQL